MTVSNELQQNTSQAPEQPDKGPHTLIVEYIPEFEKVLPPHLKSETFARLAQGALKKSPPLANVAKRNPASLMRALLDCARLGHYPGTDRFWLVPNGGKEPSVEGWESYKGVVNRMMRSGQVVTVKGQVVCEKDYFEFDPNTMDVPDHRINWREGRGDPQLSYCYAVLPGGGFSQVGVATPDYIAKVEAMQPNSHKPTSPWRKWREAMFLKCAINKLEPFVDTSTEERRTAATGGQPVSTVSERIYDQPEIEEQEPDPALERAEQAAAADLAMRHDEPVDAETVDVTALGDGERVDETAIDRSDEVQALFAEEGQ